MKITIDKIEIETERLIDLLEAFAECYGSPDMEQLTTQKPDVKQITVGGEKYDLLKCKEADGTIYIFDRITGTASMDGMDEYLEGLEKELPSDINFVPFANGKLLRLATEKEIFGINKIGNPEEGEQFECMKSRKNRVTVDEDDDFIPWWLSTRRKDFSANFAAVNGHGDAGSHVASITSIGVRPLLKIQNPEIPDAVASE